MSTALLNMYFTICEVNGWNNVPDDIVHLESMYELKTQ